MKSPPSHLCLIKSWDSPIRLVLVAVSEFTNVQRVMEVVAEEQQLYHLKNQMKFFNSCFVHANYGNWSS